MKMKSMMVAGCAICMTCTAWGERSHMRDAGDNSRASRGVDAGGSLQRSDMPRMAAPSAPAVMQQPATVAPQPSRSFRPSDAASGSSRFESQFSRPTAPVRVAQPATAPARVSRDPAPTAVPQPSAPRVQQPSSEPSRMPSEVRTRPMPSEPRFESRERSVTERVQRDRVPNGSRVSGRSDASSPSPAVSTPVPSPAVQPPSTGVQPGMRTRPTPSGSRFEPRDHFSPERISRQPSAEGSRSAGREAAPSPAAPSASPAPVVRSTPTLPRAGYDRGSRDRLVAPDRTRSAFESRFPGSEPRRDTHDHPMTRPAPRPDFRPPVQSHAHHSPFTPYYPRTWGHGPSHGWSSSTYYYRPWHHSAYVSGFAVGLGVGSIHFAATTGWYTPAYYDPWFVRPQYDPFYGSAWGYSTVSYSSGWYGGYTYCWNPYPVYRRYYFSQPVLEYPQTTVVVESAPVRVVPQTVVTTIDAPAAATVTYIGSEPAPLPQPPTLTAAQAGPSATVVTAPVVSSAQVSVPVTNRIERVEEQSRASVDRGEDAFESPFADEELNLVGQSVFEDIVANMDRFWAAYTEIDFQEPLSQQLQ